MHLFLIPFLFLVTLKTHRTYSGDGDEPHYLLIAESLFDDLDLRMENQYPDQHPFVSQMQWPGHTITTPSGSLYPVHDIGLPILMLPLLAFAHTVVPLLPASFQEKTKMDPPKLTSALFSYQSMVMTGVLCLLCFSLFKEHGFTEDQSYWMSLLSVLTAPLITHGYLYFTELYSAAILVGMVLLFRRHRNGLITGMVSAGVFMLSWLHIKNLAVVGVLCLLWLWNRDSRPPRMEWNRYALFPGIAFAAALMLRAGLHFHYFGRPSLVAAWGGTPLTLATVPVSFLGLSLDREFGLLFANPIFGLIPCGLWYLWKTKRGWWRIEGGLVLSYTAGILLFPCWNAGWSPAARHLVPMIPLLWVPLAAVLCQLWNSLGLERLGVRMLVLLAGGISICLWQTPRHFWFKGDGNNLWMDQFAFFNLHWQRALPSFFADSTLRPYSVSLTIFLLAGLNLWICRTLSASIALSSSHLTD